MTESPTLVSTEIGRRIRELRRGRPQKDFAIHLGITPQQLSRYEHGRIPDPAILVKISRAGGRSVDWLLTGKEHDGAATIDVRAALAEQLAPRRPPTATEQLADPVQLLGELCKVPAPDRPGHLAKFLRRLATAIESSVPEASARPRRTKK